MFGEHRARIRRDFAERDGLETAGRVEPKREPADAAEQVEHSQFAPVAYGSAYTRRRGCLMVAIHRAIFDRHRMAAHGDGSGVGGLWIRL